MELGRYGACAPASIKAETGAHYDVSFPPPPPLFDFFQGSPSFTSGGLSPFVPARPKVGRPPVARSSIK